MIRRAGKLLPCYYYEGTAEGASKIASTGYLDEVDSLPWDAFVWYPQDLSLGFPEGNALVCWVPAEFIDLVDAGIFAQSAPVMRWI